MRRRDQTCVLSLTANQALKQVGRFKRIKKQQSKIFVFDDYNMNDTRFPYGLCSNCNFSHLDKSSGHRLSYEMVPPRKFVIPDTEVYNNELQRSTRQTLDFSVSVLSVLLPSSMGFSGRNLCLSERRSIKSVQFLHCSSMTDSLALSGTNLKGI